MLRTEGWSLRKRGVRYIIEGKGEPDMDVKKLLEQVRDGVVQVEDAQEALKNLPYEDLGYAKLDHHRKLRSGFGETPINTVAPRRQTKRGLRSIRCRRYPRYTAYSRAEIRRCNRE